ncbi:tyrosine-type recombinase/integrase [Solihabitans fulvus]|uniref:Tyrosine-type recombinase/integrase n=2 Tax=Solihabitans fulvus TaxID=1892852 RepID=A0A5B2XGD1_9PSEU|nr:tyrosine-type recombinase/integrase [Solihabitans fulvus]
MAWVEQSGDNTWRVRYRREDNTIGAIPGFTSQTTAQNHADDMESDQRRGRWIDPAAGQTPLGEFVDTNDWLDSLDIDIRTADNYRSMLRNHIRPRWDDTALAEISNLKAQAWKKQLRATGLAQVSVDGIVKLLSLILTDAVDEKLIAANPIRARRRGRRRHSERRKEKIWAQSDPVLRLADQIAAHYGPSGAVMVVTGGWTGARWGELTGLQRPNLHLFDDDTGYIVIDPDIGTLHESAAGKLWLGPPKTDESARTITLAPFNVRLLRAHLTTHNHPHVFVTPDGALHRRSNFSRRAMRPCADGNLHRKNPDMRLQPIAPGMTFHGLRHSHKTWMIEDAIAEIAQALRLGHVMGDKVRETYSHVAATVEARLLQCLQDRWDKAALNSTSEFDTTWRTAA